MSNKIKLRILVVFSIIILCVSLTTKELQNDTFYMIKLGSYIINNGIDLKDHWCWVANLSYTYPHWGYDVIIYLIYNNFGYLGIYISSIIFFIILILLIYLINLIFNKNDFMAFFVAIISAFALFMGVTARAQVLSYIIFLLEIYFIEMLIKSGKKRYIIYLMVMSLLLANIHATIWLFYFVLFLPFLGEHVIYLVVNKFEISVNNKLIINRINNIKLLIIGFIGSFIMGIFSPSRICYTYVFKIMLGDSQSFIQEHLPLVVIQNPLFIVIVLVLLLILIFSNTKIKLKELFMIGGLVLMSLISIRHILLFYLIGMLYISIICMRYLNDKNDKTLDILLSLIVKKKLIYILYFIVVLVLGYSIFNYNYNYNQSYINEEDYPVKAVKYIKNNINLEKFRIYNDYNFGSYLMLNDIPVFIDSRCDLYLKEFNNKLDIFDDAMDLYSNYNYDKFFKKYNVNYVLVSNKTILFKFLNKDNNYIKEYDDKYFTLFKLGSVVNDK